MAPKWFEKVRTLLPGVKRIVDPAAVATAESPDRTSPDAATTQPASSATWAGQWMIGVLEFLPLGMFVIGALVSCCTELIGLWAVLGYMLVAASPVVYLLRRIERRLDQLLKQKREP